MATRAPLYFTPSAPVDVYDLFAGRWGQLMAIKEVIIAKGQHAAVFGERGVGKTSLVSVLGPVLKTHKIGFGLIVRENCNDGDSFATVWRRALRNVTFTVQRPRVGFGSGVSTHAVSLIAKLDGEPSPDSVTALLRNLPDKIVFVFDEFDRMTDPATRRAFADTIKALSDYAVASKLVVVGVGADVSDLIESHASIERALVQISVPRMTPEELEEVLAKASTQVGVTLAPEVSERIVGLSQGLPHFTHLLGLHAAKSAIARRTSTVSSADLDRGIKAAVEGTSKSILDSYRNAVDSPHRDARFREVLLACAMTATDERGTFAPGDVRPALKTIGHEWEIPAFAPHLRKFAEADRGTVLEKLGNKSHRYRYRFRNPLMQPYVLMRGVADGLVTNSQLGAIRLKRSAP